jgi:hypothetical protein
MKKDFSHIKTPGFTIPESYFQQVEAQINSRILLEKETLTQSPYKVPKGYFEQTEKAILQKTQAHPPRVISIFGKSFTKVAVAMAASIALLLTLTLWEKRTQEDFSTYIIENEHVYLNQYEIAELFPEDYLDSVPLSNGLTTDDVIEYLSYYTEEFNYED